MAGRGRCGSTIVANQFKETLVNAGFAVNRELAAHEIKELEEQVLNSLFSLGSKDILRSQEDKYFFSDSESYLKLEKWLFDLSAFSPTAKLGVFAEYDRVGFEVCIGLVNHLDSGTFGSFEVWLRITDNCLVCIPHYEGSDMRMLALDTW